MPKRYTIDQVIKLAGQVEKDARTLSRTLEANSTPLDRLVYTLHLKQICNLKVDGALTINGDFGSVRLYGRERDTLERVPLKTVLPIIDPFLKNPPVDYAFVGLMKPKNIIDFSPPFTMTLNYNGREKQLIANASTPVNAKHPARGLSYMGWLAKVIDALKT